MSLEEHPNYCWSHNQVEEDPWHRKPYLVCFECNHTFQTASSLRWDYIRTAYGLSNRFKERRTFIAACRRRVADINFCPHCAHDF